MNPASIAIADDEGLHLTVYILQASSHLYKRHIQPMARLTDFGGASFAEGYERYPTYCYSIPHIYPDKNI